MTNYRIVSPVHFFRHISDIIGTCNFTRLQKAFFFFTQCRINSPFEDFLSRTYVALYIPRTVEGFEKCCQIWVGGIFTFGTDNKIAYLKTKVDMLFFTIKHCQNFYTHQRSRRRSHSGKMYAHGDVFCFVSFWRFDPHFFSPFSIFFRLFSFAFYCAFRMLGHLSRA